MAVPKRRHSKSRVKKSRQFWRLNTPTLVPCPQCKNLKLPHHICPYCGYYKGRRMTEIKEKKKKK